MNMRTQFTVLVLVVLLIPGKTENDQLVSGCSSHCTLADKEALKCWNNTLNFFEGVILGQIRAFVLTQAEMATWKQAQGEEVDWDQIAAESVEHMVAEKPPDIENESRIDDEKVYNTVVWALVSNARNVFMSRQPQLPSVVCPLGCEKEFSFFRKLFTMSASVTVGLFGLLIALSVLRYRQVKRSVQKEASEALKNFELNAAHRKTQTFKLVDVDI